MRLYAILVAVILALTAPAVFAQETPEPPALDVPIYPNGEVTMEINMTNQDILPTLQAMLPLMTARYGDKLKGINAEDIAAAFKDLKRLQVAQVDIAKDGVTTSDIANYYATNIPKGSWNRVFWQSLGSKGTIALYTQGTGENMAIYGFKIDSKTIDEKQIKRVMVLKTEGQIDLAKLLAIAAQFMIGS